MVTVVLVLVVVVVMRRPDQIVLQTNKVADGRVTVKVTVVSCLPFQLAFTTINLLPIRFVAPTKEALGGREQLDCKQGGQEPSGVAVECRHSCQPISQGKSCLCYHSYHPPCRVPLNIILKKSGQRPLTYSLHLKRVKKEPGFLASSAGKCNNRRQNHLTNPWLLPPLVPLAL